MMLLKNYLKTAVKNYSKNSFYTLLLFSSYTLGLAGFIVLFQYVLFETSYDSFQDESNSTYRIAVENFIDNKHSNSSAKAFYPMAPILEQNLDEVITTCRITDYHSQLVRINNDISYYEDLVYAADSSIFNVLSFDIIKGSMNVKPFSIAISERIADKYYGTTECIEKTMEVLGGARTIKAVFKNYPKNSHMDFDIIVIVPPMEFWSNNWISAEFYTYLKLKPGTDAKLFQDKINNLAFQYSKISANQRRINYKMSWLLQPICSIHLNSDLDAEFMKNGDIEKIYLLIGVCLFILIISAFNFNNLLIDKSLGRLKEIAVRKVEGASKMKIAFQFFFESAIINIICLLISLLIIISIAPVLKTWLQINIDLSVFLIPKYLILLVLIIILCVIISSSIPALYLSSLKPIMLLKGIINKVHRQSFLKKLLIIFQFIISIILVATTLVILKQNNYLKNKDCGINIDDITVIKMQPGPLLHDQNAIILRERLLKFPQIKDVTYTCILPSQKFVTWGMVKRLIDDVDVKENCYIQPVTYSFMETFGLQLIAGRNFIKDNPVDSLSILINAETVKQLKYKDPEDAIGKYVEFEYFDARVRRFQIIGVLQDYYQESIKSEIKPTLFVPYIQEFAFRYYCCIKRSGDLNNILPEIEKIWKESYVQAPFISFNLRDYYDKQFVEELTLAKLLSLFSIFAIIISIAGFVGFAYNVTFKRLKEMDIRKILGADFIDISLILFSYFFKILLIAILLGLPISYLISKIILQNYVNRINLGIWFYFWPTLIILVLSFSSIVYQIIKIARSKPKTILEQE